MSNRGFAVNFFKGTAGWRNTSLAGVLMMVLAILLHATTDSFSAWERRFYDFFATHNDRQPSSQIALIAIDEKSIAALGAWPWPRDVHAQLIDKLSAAKPKALVETSFFFQPEADRSLALAQKMKAALLAASSEFAADDLPAPTWTAEQQDLADIISDAERKFDGDALLSKGMKQVGNVWLATQLVRTGGAENSTWRLNQPTARLAGAAAGMGYTDLWPDGDGVVRSVRMVTPVDGKLAPSLAMSVVSGGMQPTTPLMPTAAELVFPQFYQSNGDRPAFEQDAFVDVLNGKLATTKYADKIVIVGLTAPGQSDMLVTPAGALLSSTEALAHVISSQLQQHLVRQPSWAIWVSVTAVALVLGCVLLVLPGLGWGACTGVALAGMGVLLAADFYFLLQLNLWVKLTFPMALLGLGYATVMIERVWPEPIAAVKAPENTGQIDRMMGLALQGQGQLDMAFERFARIPMTVALQDDLYCLALDFERHQLFGKAEAVYEHMAKFDATYKDILDRLAHAQNFATAILQPSADVAKQNVAHGTDADSKTAMLGRYKIEKELGHGAMGLVYLGTDPQIGRRVALKTMALSQEFEGNDLIDARERFLREAKAAGRLQHPNIVTVFDVGEERGLAYIAMEYLKGQDLQHCTKAGQLMPVPRVLSIVARVARALAYAHAEQVIHRDIKPANVMYDIVTDSVKVTDFGIARITGSSKTKTGIVMGSPSFMSPEQLAGQVLDGRADLYSLGVMLFQLLTGTLPFKADSMAELMSKITLDSAPDVCMVRRELPAYLSPIVARLLRKLPGDRYDDGYALAEDLLQSVGPSASLLVAAPAIALSEIDLVLDGSVDLEL
jgi:serine/threonine-protein kinase